MLVVGGAAVFACVKIAAEFQPNHLPLHASVTSTPIPWLPEPVKRWEAPVHEMAKKYNIDPNLLMIIITMESGGNPKAQSGVGAQGLMQVMPGTAKDIAAKYLKKPRTSYDLYDPATNIEFGAAYLAYLRDEFGTANQAPTWDGTVELVAAGYNGGPGAAISLYKGEGLSDMQTVSYSRDALNMWRERKNKESPTYTRWADRGGMHLVKAAEAQ